MRGSRTGFAKQLAPQGVAIVPSALRHHQPPLAVVRGRYRFWLPIKALRNFDLSRFIRVWLANAPKRWGSLKLEVNIAPQSFLVVKSTVRSGRG